MSELIAKGGTKDIVWDPFGLEYGADMKLNDGGKVMFLTCH